MKAKDLWKSLVNTIATALAAHRAGCKRLECGPQGARLALEDGLERLTPMTDTAKASLV